MKAGGDAEPAQARLARDWSEMPLDTLTLVFAKLDPLEILMGAGLVCHPWLAAAKVPTLWRYLDMTSHNNVVKKKKMRSGARYVLSAMAKEAVDRSNGQLEVFMGEHFVDDDLLKYIGGGAPSLKILHLTSCPLVLNEAFVEAINKFPQLEELKLITCENIGGRATYEAVGKACQNIKHLEIGKRLPEPGYVLDHSDNSDCDEVRGIATMHGLRHLKICFNKLNNGALAALIDNCPHLESLFLQWCVNIFMDDAMRAKCAGFKMVLQPDIHKTLSAGFQHHQV